MTVHFVMQFFMKSTYIWKNKRQKIRQMFAKKDIRENCIQKSV